MKLNLIITALFVSCSIQQTGLLKMSAYNSEYLILAPKGGRLQKVTDDEGKRQYSYLYQDGSIIYITDDEVGSNLNYKNKLAKYGSDVNLLIVSKDAILLEGTSADGKAWKESKSNKIVVGYSSVPIAKKQIYDDALASIRKR